MQETYTKQDIAQVGLLAPLCYVGPIWALTWLLRRSSPFARYHIQQGASLCLFELCIVVLNAVLGFVFAAVPMAMAALAIVRGIGWVYALICIVIGMSHAVKGEAAPLPLVQLHFFQ